MGKPKRAALYLRVSTGEQTVENQRADLAKLADLRGWSVVATYEDAGISGAKGRDQRPGLNALLKDAKRRRFDVAVFWSVDRLGRSTAGVATAMDELDAAGVSQFYFKESMDTSTAHGRAMLEMAAVFARLERSMMQERVKAGEVRPARPVRDRRLHTKRSSQRHGGTSAVRLSPTERLLRRDLQDGGRVASAVAVLGHAVSPAP